MHKKTILALGGATLALAVASPVALGAGTPVTVRVEGKTRTLLQAKSIRTHGGFITRNGAPSGACSANSGAGALDVATKHRWAGSWSTSFNDYLISKILGDTESSSKFYWGIWVNNRYATSGACGLKLHRGDQVLFAVDSVAHHEHPLAIQAPTQAVAGKSFNVKVVSYSDKGKSQARGAREPRGSRPGRRHQQPRRRARRGGARRHAQAGCVRHRVRPRSAGSRARHRIGRVARYQAHSVCGDRGRCRGRDRRRVRAGGGEGDVRRQPHGHARFGSQPVGSITRNQFPAPRP